jgi:UBX domain-containing protein 1
LIDLQQFYYTCFFFINRMGAVEMTPQMFKKKNGGDETFGGVGYKLGDSVQASSSTASVGQAVGQAGAASEVQDIVLHLWSDGFTVDDGPLRSYRDPANLAFLDGVKRGEVPVELRQSLRGKDCTLSIMDKRGQDYVPPKSARAFAGRGQTLGSPTPVTIGSTGPSSEDDRKANESTARSNVQLAPGEPTTSIQFRLVDGSRLAAQFNHGHTVQDLYSFINTYA